MNTSVKSVKSNKSVKKKQKHNSTLKKCEDFCKNDYMPEMIKINEKRRKEEKRSLAAPGVYSVVDKYKTKVNDMEYKNCKKTYCNEKCEGYNFNGNTKFQKEFQKRLKHGFDERYSAKEVKMLKKRGAISGCWKVDKSYPYGYDIFHK